MWPSHIGGQYDDEPSLPNLHEVGCLVTDLTGTKIKRISSLLDATGMALSPDGATLWVAPPTTHKVARIDTVPQYTPQEMMWEEGTTHDIAQRAPDVMLAAMTEAGSEASGGSSVA